uniref:Uncharacterized protein n=1 Tax=Kocuria rosea subsp. polaris TaxID=136273 RepID=A0A0A6VM72_KOCRO|nr:hypothetical protein GY22_16925 [Kocuria polaris]
MVAVFTVTLVSVAQMVKAEQYGHVFMPISAGIGAILAPPVLALFSYGIQQRKHLPEKDRWSTVVVFGLNILLSLGAVSVVIVLGIQNIMSN